VTFKFLKRSWRNFDFHLESAFRPLCHSFPKKLFRERYHNQEQWVFYFCTVSVTHEPCFGSSHPQGSADFKKCITLQKKTATEQQQILKLENESFQSCFRKLPNTWKSVPKQHLTERVKNKSQEPLIPPIPGTSGGEPRLLSRSTAHAVLQPSGGRA